jgi:hypothetical protein
MKSSVASLRTAPAQWAIVVILACAVLLRCIGVTSRWLWLDELVTINWSVHGPWAAIVNTLRFDLHPPLYYLQISLWALPRHDDVWLMANTILWSTAAVGLLIYATSQVYGLRAGLYAGILLALAPAALAYSDQVRMYSFLAFLMIWVWYAQERWLSQEAGRFGALWMIASQISIVYSHGAGLVMLSGCVLYGAARALASGRRQTILRWFAIECAVGLAALPAVVFALMHRAAHTHSPDLREIAQTWSFLTFGDMGSTCSDTSPGENCASLLAYGDTGSAWGLAPGALLFAVLLVLAIYDKRTRLPLATLILTPLILAAIISQFKTMWLPRVFVPVVPFICLTLAMGAAATDKQSGVRTGLRTSAFMLLAVVWAGMGMYQQFSRQKGDGFKPAAELVRTMVHPGDVVLVDDNYHYWCFNWYYVGANWGDPRHAFLPDPEWTRLLRRLPASITTLLDLNNSDRSFVSGGATVELWDRKKIPPEGTADVIVVREQATRQPNFPNRHVASATPVKQLLVERWTQ